MIFLWVLLALQFGCLVMQVRSVLRGDGRDGGWMIANWVIGLLILLSGFLFLLTVLA